MVDVNVNVYDSISITEAAEVLLDCNITVYDSVVVSESSDLLATYFFGTDPRPAYYPKLPVASCEALFRETFSIDSTAPTVECTAYFGSIVTGIAPTPSAEITLEGLFAGYISVNGKVATVSGEGIFGSAVSGKAPTVSCTALISNRVISVSGYAPGVTAEIVIPNYFISVEGYSPFPIVEATLTIENTITVDGKAPTAYGTVVASEVMLITVEGIPPVAKTTYEGILVSGSFITVDGYAPVVTMNQPTGVEDPGGISITEEDRFADLTLQYSRWPDAI